MTPSEFPSNITISAGFSAGERAQVAQLYWAAFSGKLGVVMGPAPKAIAFFTDHLDPRFALTARDSDGALLGVAGFKTQHGGLIGGSFLDLVKTYGVWSACWRAALLAMLEREPEQDTLLMDGIFVSQNARGRGVGTALLTAIRAKAEHDGLTAVRLDVIDTNPRAKALYLRQGFTPVATQSIGPLSRIFKFRHSTEMHLTISPKAPKTGDPS
jgi:GNAT superfamily N-acetyltransferase